MYDYQCTSVSFIKLSNRIELFFPESECSSAQRARAPPLPEKGEIAYKAENRRPIVHSRLGSRSLRFMTQSLCVSCAEQRYSLNVNFNRRKVLGIASDVANSCHLVQKKDILTFPSRKRFVAWKHLPRRVQKEELRSSASACLLVEELSRKLQTTSSSSFLIPVAR